MASQAYLDWIKDGQPWAFARPIRSVGDRLAAHGYTVYFQGDINHLTKATPEDHTPFSATGWPVPTPYPVCTATDIMPPTPGQRSKLTGRPLPSLADLAATIRRDKMNGAPGGAWIKYMNWEPGDGNCWHDRWQPDYVRTASGDKGHIHISGRSDMVAYDLADGYDLVARTEGAGMPLYGWDASHYDAVPSGAAVYNEGFRFMTHKAGGDANDAEIGAWWTALKGQRSRMLLGAYWVLRPDLSGSAVNKADAFLARLDSECPGWRDGPFILQADCETWGGNTATRPDKAYIQAFCGRLVAKAPKLRPIVYAPNWAYGSTLSGLGYPLWASSYVTGTGTAAGLYPGDASPRWAAYGGQVPAILQFTSSATIVGQTTCDANAFRGTLDQLTALVAPGWADTMDLTAQNLAAIADAVINADILAAPPGSDPTNPTWSLNSFARNGYNEGKLARVTAQAVAQALAASRAEDASRDATLQATVDGLTALVQQLVDVIANAGGDIDSAAIIAKLDEVKSAVINASSEAADTARRQLAEQLQVAAEAEAEALRGTQHLG